MVKSSLYCKARIPSASASTRTASPDTSLADRVVCSIIYASGNRGLQKESQKWDSFFVSEMRKTPIIDTENLTYELISKASIRARLSVKIVLPPLRKC